MEIKYGTMWIKNILKRLKSLFGTSKNKAATPSYGETLEDNPSVVHEPAISYGLEKMNIPVLNGAFASFKEDWEAPEMDIYDINYK